MVTDEPAVRTGAVASPSHSLSPYCEKPPRYFRDCMLSSDGIQLCSPHPQHSSSPHAQSHLTPPAIYTPSIAPPPICLPPLPWPGSWSLAALLPSTKHLESAHAPVSQSISDACTPTPCPPPNAHSHFCERVDNYIRPPSFYYSIAFLHINNEPRHSVHLGLLCTSTPARPSSISSILPSVEPRGPPRFAVLLSHYHRIVTKIYLASGTRTHDIGTYIWCFIPTSHQTT